MSILCYYTLLLTINQYLSQEETSEIFIGEWMEKRGNRDQIVLATKVSVRFATSHR
jgi:aryl-alcohol dehydrogenase-like predicted oxidoreductase